jgi:hypothetical protein
VIVDYHRCPLGAWTAALAPDGLEALTRQARSAHDAFHNTVALIQALSHHVDVAISALHNLDGDPRGPRSPPARASSTAPWMTTPSPR